MAEINRLGKYEIRRELGRGAMGVVYEGYDPLIKRSVALKTIRSDQLVGDDSANVIARFRREAQAAGRLSHPNIVSIYDFGEEGGIWFIAMEFVKARELKDYFQANERFTMADIVRIMSQMLDALDYSHRQGVIHRDIKPANVFLLADGSVKVADFGIAHIESSNMTQVGTVLGTPSYMSPEQIMGLPVDGRSDLFSAGVVLYQFLTGERPFSGSATTTMHKVLEEDPLPPSKFNVQVPAVMDAVMRKALAKRPDERYQSAQEFAFALRAAAQAVGTTATEPTLVRAPEPTMINASDKTLANANATVKAASMASIPVRSATPTKLPIAAVLVLASIAIVAVGIAVWFILQRQSGDAVRPTQAAAPPPAVAQVATPAPSPSPGDSAAPSKSEPGTLVISAVGLIDPIDPRYQSNASLLQSDLRADSKSQLVEKAVGLLVDVSSLAKNYEVVKDKLLSQSGSFITTVVQESEPRLDKNGLMSMTTQAVVNVKAIQKSLNQMSRDERIEFIRASGDPKISVRISTRDDDQPDAPSQPSTVAENLLKERIKSFGFRTWSESGAHADETKKGAEFAVLGEVKIKKLSARLAASGLTVSKFTLTSWTVKCIDLATGEEIYYDTALPKGVGSWASEEEVLKAIGAKIGDQFSRDFFLQHVNVKGQKITLKVQGMPDAASENLLGRELVGLSAVITVRPRSLASLRVYDLQLGGSGESGDLVATAVLKPLNAKLGQTCFSLGGISGEEVSVVFDQRCGDGPVLSRLETNPPAGLYGAPPGRLKTVIKNPETLRKLVI